MQNNIYREEILEHYREPLNFGRPEKFDISSKQTNPLCGDDIEMFLKYKKDNIYNVGFLGKGCAICISACSMLTEHVKGKTKKQLTNFTEKDMLDLLKIEVSETRKKCALLGLAVLKDCLKYGI